MGIAVLYCMECGCERTMTNESAYEATRLGRQMCRGCAQKNRPRRTSKYSIINVSDVFGKWTVAGEVIRDGAMVPVICECGYTTNVRASGLISGRSKGCRSCIRKGKTSSNWRGVGDLPATVVTKIRLRAKRRKIKFELTKRFLWDLYVKQNGKCAVSGVDISFTPEGTENLSNPHMTASLDRIDSSVGYVEGNVQWVHKVVNIMKNDMSVSELVTWCTHILEYVDED